MKMIITMILHFSNLKVQQSREYLEMIVICKVIRLNKYLKKAPGV